MIKKAALSIVSAMVAFSMIVTTPAHAAFIAEPDSTPEVVSVNLYRNILETGDMLTVVYEKTPYAATPAITYATAFIWRLIDTDNTTEIAQSLGFSFDELGYGYNVISFYLSAAEYTASGITWGDTLKLRLSGTPVAFASPPEYNYDIAASDYSSETDSAQVKLDIADLILLLAHNLDVQWGLSTLLSLLSDEDTGTVLSVYGQSFFRGAIYGIQAMAPSAFPLVISAIDTVDRTWTTDYSDNLTGQHAGSDIEAGLAAGESLLDTDYNLFGLILILGICIVTIFGTWYIAGGNLWKGIVEAVPALVIGSRIGLMGLGELGLVAAICWLFISAKIMRMI